MDPIEGRGGENEEDEEEEEEEEAPTVRFSGEWYRARVGKTIHIYWPPDDTYYKGVVESFTPQPPASASSEAGAAAHSSVNADSSAAGASDDSSKAPPASRLVANGSGGDQQQPQKAVRHLPLTVRYENGDGESLDLKSERFTFTAPPRNAKVKSSGPPPSSDRRKLPPPPPPPPPPLPASAATNSAAGPANSATLSALSPSLSPAAIPSASMSGHFADGGTTSVSNGVSASGPTMLIAPSMGAHTTAQGYHVAISGNTSSALTGLPLVTDADVPFSEIQTSLHQNPTSSSWASSPGTTIAASVATSSLTPLPPTASAAVARVMNGSASSASMAAVPLPSPSLLPSPSISSTSSSTAPALVISRSEEDVPPSPSPTSGTSTILNGVTGTHHQHQEEFALHPEPSSMPHAHDDNGADEDPHQHHGESPTYHQRRQPYAQHNGGANQSKKRKRRRRSYRYGDEYSMEGGGDEDGGDEDDGDDERDERPDFQTPYGGGSHFPGGGKHGISSLTDRRRSHADGKHYSSGFRGNKRHHHDSRRPSSSGGNPGGGGSGMMLSSLPPGGTSTSHGGHGGIGRRPPRVTPIKHKKHDVKVKRLNLDEALKTANDGQVGWSEARKYAWRQLDKNPESYYYRFNAPGQKQKTGHWTDEEERAFMRRLAEVGPQKWGLFSMAINGRNGLSCSGYYRKLLLAQKVKDDNYIIDQDNKLRYVASRSAKYRRKFMDKKKFSYNYEDYFEVTGTGPCADGEGGGATSFEDDRDVTNEEDPEVLFQMLQKLDPDSCRDDYYPTSDGRCDVNALRDDILIERRKHSSAVADTRGSRGRRGRKRAHSQMAGGNGPYGGHSQRRNKRRSAGDGTVYNGTMRGYDDGTVAAEGANGTVHNGGKLDEDDDDGAHTESDDNVDVDPLSTATSMLHGGGNGEDDVDGGVGVGGRGRRATLLGGREDDDVGDEDDDDVELEDHRVLFKPLPVLAGYQNLPEHVRRFDLRYFDCCQNIEPFPNEEYAALVKQFLNERHHRVRRNLRRSSNRNRGESVLPPLIEQYQVLHERLQLLRTNPHLVTSHVNHHHHSQHQHQHQQQPSQHHSHSSPPPSSSLRRDSYHSHLDTSRTAMSTSPSSPSLSPTDFTSPSSAAAAAAAAEGNGFAPPPPPPPPPATPATAAAAVQQQRSNGSSTAAADGADVELHHQSPHHAARVLMLVYLRMLDYYVRLNPYAQAPASTPPWQRQSTRELMDTVNVFSAMIPSNQKCRDEAASTTPQASVRQHFATDYINHSAIGAAHSQSMNAAGGVAQQPPIGVGAHALFTPTVAAATASPMLTPLMSAGYPPTPLSPAHGGGGSPLQLGGAAPSTSGVSAAATAGVMQPFAVHNDPLAPLPPSVVGFPPPPLVNGHHHQQQQPPPPPSMHPNPSHAPNALAVQMFSVGGNGVSVARHMHAQQQAHADGPHTHIAIAGNRTVPKSSPSGSSVSAHPHMPVHAFVDGSVAAPLSVAPPHASLPPFLAPTQLPSLS